MKEFISTDSVHYLIVQSSMSIYRTNSTGTLTRLAFTSIDANLDSVTAFGKHFFVNNFDPGFYWDGVSSTQTIPGMPKCGLLEFGDERLYCANVSTVPAQVAISSFGSFSHWILSTETPTPADSPNLFNFQRDDGEPIECLKVTPWGKFIGKRNSTHILKGFDNDTYVKRIISPEIGCIADRSVQMVDGVLYWLSHDGIYAWDGSDPPVRIDREIEKEIFSIEDPKQRLTDLDSIDTVDMDWNGGNFFQTLPTFTTGFFKLSVSTSYSSENLSLIRSSAVFQNQGFETGDTTGWFPSGSFNVVAAATSAAYGVYMGSYAVSGCGSPGNPPNPSSHRFQIFSDTTAVIVSTQPGGYSTTEFLFDMSSASYRDQTGGKNLFFSLCVPSGADCIEIVRSSTFSQVSYLTLKRSQVALSCGGSFFQNFVLWDTVELTTHQYVNNGIYSGTFDTYFSSPVFQQVKANVTTHADTSIGFRIQSSTSANDDVYSSTVSVSDGQVPNIPRRRYVKYFADFSTSVSSKTPTLNSFQITASSITPGIVTVASAVKDHRYLLSVATAAKTNDTSKLVTLVLQKNKKWTTFVGPQYLSFAIYNKELVGGDASPNSRIWKLLQPETFNDDGAAIASDWTTKDFTIGRPHQKKVLRDIWIDAEPNVTDPPNLLSVGYAVDKSTVISSNISLSSNAYTVNGRVPAVDGQSLGAKYLRFNISHDEMDRYFRLNSLQGFYDLQPRRRDDNE